MANIDKIIAKSEQINFVPVKKTDITRLHAATIYSVKGLKSAFISEGAFRIEVFSSVVLVPLAFYLGENSFERIILIFPMFLVLIVELLNSAIEAVVDRIGPEFHSLSAKAKDISSAAVFLSLIFLFFVWITILI